MKSLLKEGQTPHGITHEATHVTVTELSRKTEGPGHKLHIDNVFSSPEPVHVKCLKCDVALCVDKTCFADYPTKT
jgi:hypothetical protein